MAEKATQKAGKRRAAGQRKAGQAKQGAGRIQVRRDTAEYRAAAQEQASRVREEIDTALADARRVREEIESRIEEQWHHRPVVKAPGAKVRAGGRRRVKS
jgi:ribosomal protein L18E